ncbi:uncharacterized protein BJ212DRAFT_1584702 [Suillus subaureus]|uniref:Uncharacterized protein n=1 Tax=Suillus subaureus TaxID=48587 RepID=A0A9P7JIT4_9AGAM|nr:uncharacterized protein BJ212DRAFT_1584702 [Suillus subaureus]KAG1824564.1 hypothetical protein BJ212DRAFT_1584702 [Suillus subaureus]
MMSLTFISTAAHCPFMSSGRHTMQVPMNGAGPIIRQQRLDSTAMLQNNEASECGDILDVFWHTSCWTYCGILCSSIVACYQGSSFWTLYDDKVICASIPNSAILIVESESRYMWSEFADDSGVETILEFNGLRMNFACTMEMGMRQAKMQNWGGAKL